MSMQSKLSRLLAKLPLLLTYSILIGTWAGFIFSIAIPEVLLRRHDLWHFTEQCIIFNLLMGLTILSLFVATTRSPGHPDPSLAAFEYCPEDDRQLPQHVSNNLGNPDMVETKRSKSRPPTLVLPKEISSHHPSDPINNASPDQEDDIPLRFLQNTRWTSNRGNKDRPSPLPLPTSRIHLAPSGPETPLTASEAESEQKQGFTPTLSPFPFALSPLVPNTRTQAGDDTTDEDITDLGSDSSDEETGLLRDGPGPSVQSRPTRARTSMTERRKGFKMKDEHDLSEDDEADDEYEVEERSIKLEKIEREVMSLLHQQREEERHNPKQKALFAKNDTGKPRFCRKCQIWKPDRSHHCRFCKRCVLKMDHHCVWLATCVGHRNYKPFLLFITYGTITSIYIALESFYQVYLFFSDDLVGSTGTSNPQVEFAPILWILLTMAGGLFTLAMGGLSSYHWFLTCNDLTTLEHISHTYPTALLPLSLPPASQIDPPTSTNSTYWKPDHLLTRPERRILIDSAKDINVYDLGWRMNLYQTLIGDQLITGSGATGRMTRIVRGVRMVGRGLWPLSTVRNGDGHGFEYDQQKLGVLRGLTEELRLGKRLQVNEESETGHDEGLDEEGHCGNVQ